MIGTRYEEYSQEKTNLPFVFNNDLVRTPFNCSLEKNWHEDLEIQQCVDGDGWVIVNGEKQRFSKGDVIVVGSNAIHYTGTDSRVVYSCAIIKSWFCNQIGINYKELNVTQKIKSEKVNQLFSEIKKVYLDEKQPLRTAKLYVLATELMIEIFSFATSTTVCSNSNLSAYETVKKVIKYIRDNYAQKVYVEQIAKHVAVNKYALCRLFKKLTGQTIVDNLNRYRILKAKEFLSSGYAVSETAYLCGFENLSFFTSIFKRYTGILPSTYIKNLKSNVK